MLEIVCAEGVLKSFIDIAFLASLVHLSMCGLFPNKSLFYVIVVVTPNVRQTRCIGEGPASGSCL